MNLSTKLCGICGGKLENRLLEINFDKIIFTKYEICLLFGHFLAPVKGYSLWLHRCSYLGSTKDPVGIYQAGAKRRFPNNDTQILFENLKKYKEIPGTIFLWSLFFTMVYENNPKSGPMLKKTLKKITKT